MCMGSKIFEPYVIVNAECLIRFGVEEEGQVKLLVDHAQQYLMQMPSLIDDFIGALRGGLEGLKTMWESM